MEDFKYYISVEDGECIGRTQSLSGGNVNDIEVSEEIYNDFFYGENKYIPNDTNDKIILNPNYVDRREQEKQKQLLLEQIDELDKKRIRAICEPSIKDKTTGETWLDYYNKQVSELRAEINKLQNPETENNEPKTENDLLGINEIPFET